mmetsp:Transcript_230/g.1092  ORF Transcript_230/g.1092 Transcript_230/m.1092 type:complete len:267 (+) Transcript_230:819-1619(+)
MYFWRRDGFSSSSVLHGAEDRQRPLAVQRARRLLLRTRTVVQRDLRRIHRRLRVRSERHGRFLRWNRVGTHLERTRRAFEPALTARPPLDTRRLTQQVAVTLLHRRGEQHARAAKLEIPRVVPLAGLADSRGRREHRRSRRYEERRRLVHVPELRHVLHREEGELKRVGAAHGDGDVLALVRASEPGDERRFLRSFGLEVSAVWFAVGALLVDAPGFLGAHAAVLARDDDGPVARGAALVADWGYRRRGWGWRGRGRRFGLRLGCG